MIASGFNPSWPRRGPVVAPSWPRRGPAVDLAVVAGEPRPIHALGAPERLGVLDLLDAAVRSLIFSW